MRDKLSDVTQSAKVLWRGLGGLQVAFWAGRYPAGVVHVPLQVVFSPFRVSSRLLRAPFCAFSAAVRERSALAKNGS